MNATEQNAQPPVHVLIAEDSPTQSERLKYTLERNGYQVTATTNGRQALEAARAQTPMLVISDVLMPEMDGYQLCQHIKSDPQLKRLPVILVTTLADPQDVIRGLESGADNFVVKPYDERYLLSRIQFVLLNNTIHEHDRSENPVEIYFNGERRKITADRVQILNLLLSTYEAAIQRNQELTYAKDELRTLNASLETTNKELETAIAAERRTHQALKEAQSQLVQAEKLAGLGQMVAGVAHEINNPLSFVTNNFWVLQRDLQGIKQLLNVYRAHDALITEHNAEAGAQLRQVIEQPETDYTLNTVEEVLEASRDGLKRIDQIVRDLRDFARLDRQPTEEVDLNAGVQSTVNIVLGRAKKKQVQLDTRLSDLPSVACYPAKINQVVMNLISNAIDASPPGGVVTVITRAGINEAQIEVVDHGSGIDPKVKERIFDPFFTTKPQGEGVGLGLSVSYGIIQEHHGTIEVDSTPGQGARFTIHLPLRPLQSAA